VWHECCVVYVSVTGLKTDLHLHTREAEPWIGYNARALIARAAHDGYRVLSVTNHDTLTFDESLSDYARARGIVLIPGAEVTIEGRHVLLYNFDVHVSAIQTFARLRRFKGPDWLVVAPHPFFPGSTSLGNRLLDEIDVFDAIESSHFYTRMVDFNRRAAALAREMGLPLLGTSDSHLARQFGTTYSLVQSEPTVACVLSAIRKGHVQIVSHPLTLRDMTVIAVELGLRDGWHRAHAALRPRVSPPEQARADGRSRAPRAT
jgi:predicted metal-dependent phosphoesterase TrpH